MISRDDIDIIAARADAIADRYRDINTQFLRIVGERIKEIGQLRPKELHQIEQMLAAEQDAQRIINAIAQASDRSKDNLDSMLVQSAQDDLEFSEIYYKYKNIPVPKAIDNERIIAMVEAVSRQASGQLDNLSLTTALKLKTDYGGSGYYTLASGYKRVVSDAVLAVQNGTVDYNTAIRSTLRSLADSGIKVIEYESGYMRRIDAAARMNILDGVRQINQQMQDIVGEQIGADGVELSAHLECAEDHLPYQGLQYSMEDFERLQATLKRPIGQWNCRHKRYAIILGVSKPVYSAEDLEQMRRYNRRKITIDGEQYNIMQARQILNGLASQRQQQQDRLTLYRASGDTLGVAQAQDKITQIDAQYKQIQDIIDSINLPS